MKIRELYLYTDKLELQRKFYSRTLGFEMIEESGDSFAVRIGWSELSFKRSDISHTYHYCFLIPSNKLMEALDWLERKVDIIKIKKKRKIQGFEAWNADSFYFHDASGNIAEFIVRYDLKNESESKFDSSGVLCVNEIGMPTRNIEKINAELERMLKTKFWWGNLSNFGTNGSQEGLFLLPNYEIKDKWFPTNQKIKSEPFEMMIENNGIEYGFKFEKGKIEKLELTKEI